MKIFNYIYKIMLEIIKKFKKTYIEKTGIDIIANISWKEEKIDFIMGDEYIGIVLFESYKYNIIHKINFISNKTRDLKKSYKGVGTYMITYILENFVESELEIVSIEQDAIGFYKKLIKKLKKQKIIKDAKFIGDGIIKDLILYK